jgi:hypothetical protein
VVEDRLRIADVDGQAATISLDRPIERFASGKLRCAPLALGRLDTAPSCDASPVLRDCVLSREVGSGARERVERRRWFAYARRRRVLAHQLVSRAAACGPDSNSGWWGPQ